MTKKFKVGSAVFALSKIRRKTGSREYEYVRLRWSECGSQIDKTFPSEKEARAFAKGHEKTTRDGGLQLKPKDAETW